MSSRYVHLGFYVPADEIGHYYVDATNGDDSNSGGLTAPWKTLSKVNSSTFSPGDQILFRCGETWNERLIPPSNGSGAGYITFSYYGTGADPIIDGTGISISDGGLVHIDNKDYIKIIRLNVINSDDFGIYVHDSSYIDVQYNTTESTHASGIGILSSDQVWVNHNTVVNARCVTLANGGHEESITLEGVTNFEVGNNDISMDGVDGYLGNEGIDCKVGTQHGTVHHNYIHGFTHEGGAIYVDGWDAALTGDIDIYCNRCWGNPNGIVVGSEQGGTVDDVNIYNNLVYNVYDTGIGIAAGGSDGLRSNIHIYHNTVYKAQYNGGAAIHIISDNIDSISIFNNITYFEGTNGQIVADSDVVSEIDVYNNLSYGSTNVNAGYIELSTNPGGNPTVHDNITANPLFVSTVTPDLHLQSNSPAIGRAYIPSLLVDFEGNIRPQGTNYDIGAYEYEINTYTEFLIDLFNDAIISYLPLGDASGTVFQDAYLNNYDGVAGGTSGPILGVTGIGDGNTAVSFTGSSAYINWYSTGLRDAFNKAEGSLITWAKVSPTSVWSDGSYRVITNLYVDSNNYITFARSDANNNRILMEYIASGTSRNVYAASDASTGWLMVGITWSIASGTVIPYINGAELYDLGAPGVWQGTLNTNACVLGALTTGAGSRWKGSIAHPILLNRSATNAEMLNAYRYLDGTKVLTILGDSISAIVYNSLKWMEIVRDGYNTGLTSMISHAISGQRILDHLATQVVAAANDNADIVIIEMGTNDITTTGLQAEVEENIIQLKSDHPNANIYFMNILPRWTDATGNTEVDESAKRTAIAAACTAQSITCWDTYTTPWITAADTTDGLHPNAAGHVKIAAEVLERLP